MIEFYLVLLQKLEDEGISQKKRREIHFFLMSYLASTDNGIDFHALDELLGHDKVFDLAYKDLLG